MNILTVKNKTRTFWLLQTTSWGVYWLFNLLIVHENALNRQSPVFFIWTFLAYFSGFWISLLLRWFYKKIKFKSRSLFGLSCVVLLGSFFASQIWMIVDQFLNLIFATPENPAIPFGTVYYISLTITWSLVLIAWSILYLSIKFWMEWQIQKEKTELANDLAHDAQMQMLRYQLNPHFLFNSLNSIRALIHEDRKNAKSMITELSEFLRYSLLSNNNENVPLRCELNAIKHYLAIEKKRYEEKLKVRFDVDPEAENFPVLSFLIHPIVENAIKYGMQTSHMPLELNISASRKGDCLKICICNSGSWLGSSSGDGKGKQGTRTGMENIRQRLENTFAGNYLFNVFEKNECVHVELEMPEIPASEITVKDIA